MKTIHWGVDPTRLTPPASNGHVDQPADQPTAQNESGQHQPGLTHKAVRVVEEGHDQHDAVAEHPADRGLGIGTDGMRGGRQGGPDRRISALCRGGAWCNPWLAYR